MANTPPPTPAAGAEVPAEPAERAAVEQVLADPGAADRGADVAREVRLAESNIVTAMNPEAIGTRVTNPERFREILAQAIIEHEKQDRSGDDVPGQYFITLPGEVLECVSCGVGERTADPEDYVTRLYRGEVQLFLKRDRALIAESCPAIVYTRDAYLKDPDINKPENAVEKARFETGDGASSTHVLVAVLASAGPKPPLSPHRLVYNLAGGNNAAKEWDADRIRKEAAAAQEYWNKYCTVAD